MPEATWAWMYSENWKGDRTDPETERPEAPGPGANRTEPASEPAKQAESWELHSLACSPGEGQTPHRSRQCAV